ncbi:RusA family crossover junction endodeoxyribonuclease [Candidatus Poriferisodalis sp.]|uniref:RusA family crossover junction endodeoxyribonuclease n=1 Tax=Candidatus Poriferisodalis sp. TaxID=3101277 RepID=UPI003B58D49A
MDTDNIIKPIQDALEDLVYENDETVVDVCARKVSRRYLSKIVDPPAALDDALASAAGDFVYVRVAAAHREVTFS